jgi:D-glycerate 3-kinase
VPKTLWIVVSLPSMSMPNEKLEAIANHVVPRVEQYRLQRQHNSFEGPFLLCISGLQGSGKSTFTRQLEEFLHEKHHLKVVGISIDDFYHDHETLVKVRNHNMANGLLRTRGQPGTHDEQLAAEFFASLSSSSSEELKIPSFDKSQFNGEGDRVAPENWKTISRNPPVDVVIFEGWCIGFQALEEDELEQKWKLAKKQAEHGEDENEQRGFSTTTLSRHPLEHLKIINANLRRYNETFMKPEGFHFFIHLDTDQLVNVYKWRLDQEHQLQLAKGMGMTDEEVIKFVQGYMPAYELYLDKLRRESFVPRESGGECTQLRILLDESRSILSIREI